MAIIKRINGLHGNGKEYTFYIDEKEIKSDYSSYQQDELVLYIEKGSILTEGFTKQYFLHKTKTKKVDSGFKLKEDVAIPLRLVFPTAPNITNGKGNRVKASLSENDYDFSDLLNIKKPITLKKQDSTELNEYFEKQEITPIPEFQNIINISEEIN